MNYDILRWDVILAENGVNKLPVIYIKTDDINFIDFIENNNYVIMVDINNTNTIYDEKQIIGTVRKTQIPNIYLIKLNCVWFGYPDINSPGQITI
jgi:hypothetical protein